MVKLELTILVKSQKHKEFKQTLVDLSNKLQKPCASLKIVESDNILSFSLVAQWKTTDHMREAFKTNEFKILFGAIEALCEKIKILFDDKLIGNHISCLNTL